MREWCIVFSWCIFFLVLNLFVSRRITHNKKIQKVTNCFQKILGSRLENESYPLKKQYQDIPNDSKSQAKSGTTSKKQKNQPNSWTITKSPRSPTKSETIPRNPFNSRTILKSPKSQDMSGAIPKDPSRFNKGEKSKKSEDNHKTEIVGFTETVREKKENREYANFAKEQNVVGGTEKSKKGGHDHQIDSAGFADTVLEKKESREDANLPKEQEVVEGTFSPEEMLSFYTIPAENIYVSKDPSNSKSEETINDNDPLEECLRKFDGDVPYNLLKNLEPTVNHIIATNQAVNFNDIDKNNIFKTFGAYMKVSCTSCNSVYENLNPPCLQKCGTSICSKCNFNSINNEPIFNSSLPNENETRHRDIVNKDLFSNSSIILQCFKQMKLWDKVNKDQINYGEIIYSLDNYEENIKNVKKYNNNNTTKEKEPNFKIESLIFLEKYIGLLTSLRLMIEHTFYRSDDLKVFYEDLNSLEEAIEDLDENLYYIIFERNRKKNTQIGLRVNELSVMDFLSREDYGHVACFALSENSREQKYYPIHFTNKHYYIGTCTNFKRFPPKKDFVIFNYESIRCTSPLYGIFFELQFQKQTRKITIILDENSDISLKNQLMLLCSGEEGPCYTGGIAKVDKQKLLLYYRDGERNSSKNINPHIPDKLGTRSVLEIGMVSVTKNYGTEGNCICITLDKTRDTATCIGHVLNEQVLKNMQCETWSVVNSGWVLPS